MCGIYVICRFSYILPIRQVNQQKHGVPVSISVSTGRVMHFFHCRPTHFTMFYRTETRALSAQFCFDARKSKAVPAVCQSCVECEHRRSSAALHCYVTFHMTRSRREMYGDRGHVCVCLPVCVSVYVSVCLCVCLSVWRCIPTLLYVFRCNFVRTVGVPSSYAAWNYLRIRTWVVLLYNIREPKCELENVCWKLMFKVQFFNFIF